MIDWYAIRDKGRADRAKCQAIDDEFENGKLGELREICIENGLSFSKAFRLAIADIDKCQPDTGSALARAYDGCFYCTICGAKYDPREYIPKIEEVISVRKLIRALKVIDDIGGLNNDDANKVKELKETYANYFDEYDTKEPEDPVKAVCKDTYEHFAHGMRAICEDELIEWICDRLREDDLIGITTGVIIERLIEDGVLIDTSANLFGHDIRCYTFRYGF